MEPGVNPGGRVMEKRSPRSGRGGARDERSRQAFSNSQTVLQNRDVPMCVAGRPTRHARRARSPMASRAADAIAKGRIADYPPPMNYREIITIEPDKRSGKPCIRGTRMTVTDVLEYLAGGMTHQELLDEFPDLTEEDIRACLAFAADRERKLASLPA